MAIGPMQLIAIGFDPTDRCQRRIRRELQELQGRGVIRVIDTLMINKDSQGAITRLEGSQPSNDELGSAGSVLGILIGLDTRDSAISPSTDVGALAFAGVFPGVANEILQHGTQQVRVSLHAKVRSDCEPDDPLRL